MSISGNVITFCYGVQRAKVAAYLLQCSDKSRELMPRSCHERWMIMVGNVIIVATLVHAIALARLTNNRCNLYTEFTKNVLRLLIAS